MINVHIDTANKVRIFVAAIYSSGQYYFSLRHNLRSIDVISCVFGLF